MLLLTLFVIEHYIDDIENAYFVLVVIVFDELDGNKFVLSLSICH